MRSVAAQPQTACDHQEFSEFNSGSAPVLASVRRLALPRLRAQEFPLSAYSTAFDSWANPGSTELGS